MQDDRHPWHVLNDNDHNQIKVAKLLRLLDKINLTTMMHNAPVPEDDTVNLPIQLIADIFEARDDLERSPGFCKAYATERNIDRAEREGKVVEGKVW